MEQSRFAHAAFQIEARCGLCKDAFSGAFQGDPHDEDGIFRWRRPYISASNFTLVAQHEADTSPQLIARDTVARLQPLMNSLDLIDVAAAIRPRFVTQDPTYEMFTSHRESMRGTGWEPFAIETDTIGDT